VSITIPVILRIQSPSGVRDYPPALPVTYIGRASDNQIVLDESTVSRHHAKLEWSSGVLYITDLDSANGTRINKSSIKPGDKYPLKDADAISIGGFLLTVRYLSGQMAHGPPQSRELALQGRSTANIGRQSDNDIVLSHPTVSRKHARVIWNDQVGKHLIEDLHSTNGTFVNGKRVVRPRLLRPGDTIQIGPAQLTYKLEKISAVDQSRDLRLDALGLNRLVDHRNLLQNISLSIQPHEFVAIVGASGAGKSTLLHALSGYHPATSGAVLLNGIDLYSNFGAYRSQVGFVPQSNIIHMELTVYEALDYSARLRLPSDMSQMERERRTAEVLDALGLTKCKDQPIHSLSGGEQKRVSIGVELLTEPGLFFLDEATSGLDPGTELEIMTMLRHLSDQGHTVVLVTHATKNVEKCHSVAILAKGGYLAYYGPPKEALGYFGVGDFDEIYGKLKSVPSESAAERYLKSSECQKYLTARLPKGHVGQSARISYVAAPGASSKEISSLRQFSILSRRNFSILFRDKVSLMLMLLIPTIIAMLDFLFWRKGLFATDGGDARFALMNLFMAAMVCCLVGALSSMREIVKETDIYRRERMVVLKIMPYVLSKVLLCLLLALYSSAIFILFMELSGGWPPLGIVPTVYLTMVLSVLGGTLLGLFISALSPNPNVTPLLLLLVLVPQLLFGGIIPAGQVAQPGKLIGYATTTKWTFESLVKSSSMGDDVIGDPCWSLTEDEREALNDTEKTELCKCMGANLFSECDFPGIRDYYVDAIDRPEPLQPIKPSPPPTNPQAMKAYDEEMRQYQADMDTWQQEYQNWQEKRSKAIGEAEGRIKATYNDYEQAFKANVKSNWLVLFIITLVLFCMVLGVLKWKDRR
jgi:ABC-type multidrug transport system ATPase subunit/pSer/pThr/pTyr-binding forkhead associated (FHA) protein